MSLQKQTLLRAFLWLDCDILSRIDQINITQSRNVKFESIISSWTTESISYFHFIKLIIKKERKIY